VCLFLTGIVVNVNTGAAGGLIVAYGAPVLPGSMFMLAHIGGVPVLGLPGLGLSGAEIARHLGVNTSSVNRAISRAEKYMDK